MKMKSYFLGFNVKLALMLIAVCSMFASCYEKDEIDVPTPSTEAPIYKVGGVVTDAETGEPLAGATVNGTTTDASGKYEFTTSAGIQVIRVSKDGYKAETTSINVAEIENGKVATYIVNASLYRIPTYMENVYSIEGSAYNEAGDKIAMTKVAVLGCSVELSADKKTFTVNDVKPGTYSAIVSAEGYNTAYATVVISEAGKVEGSAADKNKVVTTVSVIMQKAAEAAKYFVEGNIRTVDGLAINGANLSVTLTSGEEIACTYANGYFNGVIETPLATATMVTVRVTKEGYYPYVASTLITPVKPGEISVTSFNITMKAMDNIVEDPSVGGSSVADVLEGGKVESKPVDEVKNIPVEGAGTIANVLESMKETTGAEVSSVENMPIVTVAATGINTELKSEIVKQEGSTSTTVTEIDQIKIAPETQVIYTKGVAENIGVTRDVAAEKTTAAVRSYEGTPDGVIFTKPLEIAFEAPVVVEGGDVDFVLPVLYYNESTGKWVADGDNYAEYSNASQKFVAKVAHFSKFKFGYESSKEVSQPTPLAPVKIAKSCYTGAASQVITVKGTYKGGSMYADGTPAMAAAAALNGAKESTIAYVADLLTKMIKADNMGIAPKNNYVDTEFSYDMTIPAYQQVTGFDIVRNEVVKTYTVKVVTADRREVPVTVEVKSISSVVVSADKAESHGHSHGDDLNAGGGIVELD